MGSTALNFTSIVGSDQIFSPGNTTGNINNWNEIASRLPGRTNKDCRKRWSKIGKSAKKGHWSVDEDNRLRKAVEQCGSSWTMIAQKVGTRHADQCSKRWCDFLDPALSHKEWSDEEYDRLLEAVQTYGRSWKLICKNVFPDRSATDIKNRHAAAQRRRDNSMEPSQHNSEMFAQDMETFSPFNSYGSESGSSTPFGANLPGMNKNLEYNLQLQGFPSLVANYSDVASTSSLPQNSALASTFSESSELTMSPSTTEHYLPDQIFDKDRHVSIASSGLPLSTDNFATTDYDLLDANSGPRASFPPSMSGSFAPQWSLPFLDGDHQNNIPLTDATTSDLSNNDEKPRDPSQNTYTVLLEDVEPNMLHRIVNTVVGARETVKMKITSLETDT